MEHTIKDKIYSNIEDRYINVMDVEKIIIEDAEEDLGYYRITAFLNEKNGWKNFNGKIDSEGWTYEGLINLANIRNKYGEKCSAVAIGLIYVNPGVVKEINDSVYSKLWGKVLPKAEKFAADIKKEQNNIRVSKIKNCFYLTNY